MISIIVLLMALLMPALSRARRQARAVVCQTHLHQWGLRVAVGASEDDASPRIWNKDTYGNTHEVWDFIGNVPPPESRSRDIRFCPMASTLVNDEISDLPDLIVTGYGGTFRAWGHIFLNRPQDISVCGSYGKNGALSASKLGRTRNPGPLRGASTDVRGPSRVPVLLDSTWVSTSPGGFEAEPPPQSDAIPTAEPNYERVWKSCINRHDGGVNSSFFDGSVRKVGLKELWTLKWWPDYNTANPWTLAGGVQPSDWPEWMRKFKDY